MDDDKSVVNDVESTRIKTDLKRHNWLLNKIKIRQDISFRRIVKPSMPVSVPLHLLSPRSGFSTKRRTPSNNVFVKSHLNANRSSDSANNSSKPALAYTPFKTSKINKDQNMDLSPKNDHFNARRQANNSVARLETNADQNELNLKNNNDDNVRRYAQVDNAVASPELNTDQNSKTSFSLLARQRNSANQNQRNQKPISRVIQTNNLSARSPVLRNRYDDINLHHNNQGPNTNDQETASCSPASQRTMKHNLPVQVLPNRERYNIQKPQPNDIITIPLPMKLKPENVTTGTQTTKVNFLSDKEYAFYKKCCESPHIDLTDSDKETKEEVKTNKKEPLNDATSGIIGEKDMVNILISSDAYKKRFSKITTILQNIINFTDTNDSEENENILHKKLDFLKSIQHAIYLLMKCEEERIAKNSKNIYSNILNAVNRLNVPVVTQSSNQEQEIVQLDAQGSTQQEQSTTVQKPNEHTNYLEIPKQVNANNVNPTNAISTKENSVFKMPHNLQTAENRQPNPQEHRMFQQMVQMNRMPERRNNYPNQFARLRFARERWPYPRLNGIEPYQAHQMQPQETEQIQAHHSQYVPFNQFQNQQNAEIYGQQQNPYNPRQPFQQQVMYNNYYT